VNRLDDLESQSIFILREAFSRLRRIALLWSLGKDSNVMVWIARKAFFGRVPFPLLHVDTGKKFPEMYAFRDPGDPSHAVRARDRCRCRHARYRAAICRDL
jgi:sulfate adenylyltransferase subunit 2